MRFGWNHLLMQHPYDQHLPGVSNVKHDVLANLKSAQTRVKNAIRVFILSPAGVVLFSIASRML